MKALAIAVVALLALGPSVEPEPVNGPTLAGTVASTERSIAFEENRGQFADDVRFAARTPEGTVFLTDDGARLEAKLAMKFPGARTGSSLVGGRPLEGTVNYFLGNDAEQWVTNVPTYSTVRREDLRSGVDLVWYTRDGQLEFDLVLAPGADPDSLGIEFPDAESVGIDDQGNLRVRGNGAAIRLNRPLAYQMSNGKRREVACRFLRTGDSRIGFDTGEYDAGAPLVIDPVYVVEAPIDLRDDADNLCVGIVLDDAGNRIVAGNPAKGPADVVVTRLSAGGVVLSTSRFGGSGDDVVTGVTRDAAGRIYLTGRTASSDFPVVDALQPTLGGLQDAFVLVLDPTGASIAYSTYLGGPSSDGGLGVAADAAGGIHLIGRAGSDFPLENAIQATESYYFAAKIAPGGAALSWSTYLPYRFEAAEIAVDAAGSAYIACTDTLYEAAVVLKIDSAGSRYVYITTLNGSGSDAANCITVDGAGRACVTGTTMSSDFPTVAPIHPQLEGASDDFVVRLAPDGTPRFASYFPAGEIVAAATDASGNTSLVYADSPIVRVMRFDPTVPAFVYLGGLRPPVFTNSYVTPTGTVVGPTGTVHVVGRMTDYNHGDRGFVARLAGYDGGLSAMRVGLRESFEITGGGFGTRKPKVKGSRTGASCKMKVIEYSPTRLVVMIKKGTVGEYVVVVDPKDKELRTVMVTEKLTLSGPANVVCVPASAPPRAEIRLTGEYFGAKKGKVRIGGKKAKVVAWSSTGVTVRLSKKAAAGPSDVVIRTKLGEVVLAGAFTVE